MGHFQVTLIISLRETFQYTLIYPIYKYDMSSLIFETHQALRFVRFPRMFPCDIGFKGMTSKCRHGVGVGPTCSARAEVR